MVVYFLQGIRKRVWRSDLTQAKANAEEACENLEPDFG
jgi:hypothetical protein